MEPNLKWPKKFGCKYLLWLRPCFNILKKNWSIWITELRKETQKFSSTPEYLLYPQIEKLLNTVLVN